MSLPFRNDCGHYMQFSRIRFLGPIGRFERSTSHSEPHANMIMWDAFPDISIVPSMNRTTNRCFVQ